MQVALVVAANQLLVSGESHVAFLDAGAHARAGFMAFPGVLWKLQSAAAAVGDREVGLAERALAATFQLALERPGAHLVDQIIRTRPDLDAGFAGIALASGVGGVGKNRQQQPARTKSTAAFSPTDISTSSGARGHRAVREERVDLRNRRGPLADGAAHALDRSAAHVSDRENAGHAGLQRRP